MVILGLLLIGLGTIAILAAIFVSEGSAELLGMNLSALAIFLVGIAAGACVLWGFTLLRLGTRRELRARREHRRLTQLSEKLARVEAERRDGPQPQAEPRDHVQPVTEAREDERHPDEQHPDKRRQEDAES